MAESRLAGEQVEILSNSASPECRLSGVSVELLCNVGEDPQVRLTGVAIEVLAPKDLVFIGWGSPVEIPSWDKV